jgi:quercetin dioxygenase-like cupin family protein
MTVGEAVINPGQENALHFHPNCDEVLHVEQGRILSTAGDSSVELKEGDTVSIPAGVRHKAKNLGTSPAVLAISFSSPDRQVVNE